MAAPRTPPSDALLEDYKLKNQFATDVIGRYGNQSQAMLSLQSAIAIAGIIGAAGRASGVLRWVAIVELLLSVVWLGLGVQGRKRVDSSRTAASDAGKAWAAAVGLPHTYQSVGDGHRTVVVGVVGPAGLLLVWVVVTAYLWLAR